MPRTLLIRTTLDLPSLSVIRAVPLDRPLEHGHLPPAGHRHWVYLNTLAEDGPHTLVSAYEMQDGDGGCIGVTLQPAHTTWTVIGEWIMFRSGRQAIDRTSRLQRAMTLRACAQELALREERSVRDWSRRRRIRAADREAIEGLVPSL
ncbi:hypothetical protein [Methylobacterium brachythecii]|uniref:Uncharacterized protein n=1 Tax=Methylobacterium brachythecii TaxID=1176177 RepID=A0A7W6F9A7_9HYPH|nr:hypothetical protein [Methylobacterium brachythecii]MBB3905300.1 hypothetical protein [Methylobacterium brachythecii]GLS45926.1 hypothetical protein GCM10007884_39170 [Methylobacterium brachythecii]